eukprot:g1614.t1
MHEHIGPGPAAYGSETSFGLSSSQAYERAPVVGFGTSVRPGDRRAKDAPGPGEYKMRTLLGETYESTLPSAPSPSLAGREAFGSMTMAMGADKNPGPGAHTVNGAAIGKQVSSEVPSQPSYSFGTAPARVTFKSQHRVGPDAYKMPSSVGRQVQSTVKTASYTRFGHARQRPGPQNVNPTGPGEYKTGSTIGRQEESTMQSAATWKFGTSTRPEPFQECATMRARLAPPQSSMGRQAFAGSRSAPSAGLSGREEFGSTVMNNVGPGPAAYVMPASVGKQSSSQLESSPMVSFGTSTRPQAKMRSGAGAPGPGAYPLDTMLGPDMKESTKPSAPAPAMAGREKFGSAVDNKDAAKTPGPGSYAVSGKHGGRFRNPPKHTLGGKWPPMTTKNATPAPDAYKAASGFATQLHSQKRTHPSVKFGRGNRFTLNAAAANEIGPGEYSQPPSVGRQTISTRASAGTPKFGTEIQRPDMSGHGASKKSPGPGKYSLPSAIQKQASSTKRNAPASSLSGRTKFGSFM